MRWPWTRRKAEPMEAATSEALRAAEEAQRRAYHAQRQTPAIVARVDAILSEIPAVEFVSRVARAMRAPDD